MRSEIYFNKSALLLVMASWMDEETIKLIKIWSEDALQAMMEGSRRNKELFVKNIYEEQN